MIYTPFNNGDENIYAAQVVAASRGELFSGDYFSGLPFLGPLLLGWLTKLWGSVSTTFILADFFLPAVVFLLIVRLVRELTGKNQLGIIAGLASLFLYQLTTKINLFNWTEAMFFNFNRLIPPQLTFIFFLLFLLSFWRRTLWAGVWAGIMAYVYFYHWSAAVVILALRRRFRELLVAGIISFPYLYLASRATVEQQFRFGRLEGRFFELRTTALYLVVIAIIYFSGLNQKITQFFSAIFLAAIALMNLQLLTGFTIAPGHWPSSTFQPLVPAVLVVVFGRYLLKHRQIVAGLIFAYALINQIRVSQEWSYRYWLTPQDQAVVDFFRDKPGRPLVATLDKRLNFYLPILTNVRLYLPYGSYSALTNDQLRQRFICTIAWSRLDSEEVEQTLNDTQIIGHLFDLTYNQNLTVFSFGQRRLPDPVKDRIRQELAVGPNCPGPVDYVILKDGSIDEPRL